MTDRQIIPLQLQNSNFKFCLVKAKGKQPFENAWQEKGYAWNDQQLQNHIKAGGNYGVIGGHGRLVVLDVDDKALGDQLLGILQTFSVQTCGGSYHFYFLSDYDKNHVWAGKGELRAKSYMVVGPGCYAIDTKKGHEGPYKVAKDMPIMAISPEGLSLLLEPFFKSSQEAQPAQEGNATDTSRSGMEFGRLCRYIKQGLLKQNLDKTWIFNAMNLYSKWKESSSQYREHTWLAALKKVSQEAEGKQEVQAMKPISGEELLNLNVPQIEWHIQGLIPKRGVTILGGDSGSLKSMTALHLAVSIATKTKFLNQFDICATGAPIVYVDEENRVHTLRARVGQLKNGLKEDAKPLDRIRFLIEAGVKLDVAGSLEALKQALDDSGITPQLIIFDSFIRFFSGDENFSSDVKLCFDSIKDLMQAYDCGVILLHHLGKNVRPSKSALRGSSDLAAFADVILMLEHNRQYNNYVMSQVKNRHAEEGKPMVINLLSGPEELQLSFKQYLEDKETTVSLAKDKLLAWFGEDVTSFRTKDALAQCKPAGISERSVYEAINELIAEKALKRLKMGVYQVISGFQETLVEEEVV